MPLDDDRLAREKESDAQLMDLVVSTYVNFIAYDLLRDGFWQCRLSAHAYGTEIVVGGVDEYPSLALRAAVDQLRRELAARSPTVHA